MPTEIHAPCGCVEPVLWLRIDPDPQNLMNADQDSGEYNHQIDFNPSFKS